MGFSSIHGQSSIISLLQRSINENSFVNLYIFSGNKGMGKKTIAYEFSKKIVCKDKREDNCRCKACLMADARTHPDIIRLLPEDGKKTIGVDEARTFAAMAYTKPYMAEKKIFIIENAELLTPAAQNALLKVIEEPPMYVIFILLVGGLNILLETVRSRAMILEFTPYTPAQMDAALKYNQNYDKMRNFLLSYTNCNIGQALELLTDEDFSSFRSDANGMAMNFINSSPTAIFDCAEFFEKNKERYALILDFFQSLIRDVIFFKLGMEISNTDETDKINKLSDKISIKTAVKIIDKIINTKTGISRNYNYNLTVLSFLSGSWEEING